MAVRANVGKVSEAIRSGKAAYNSMDTGPISTLATVSTEQNAITADWHEVDDNPLLFIFGVDNWGDTTLKVSK